MTRDLENLLHFSQNLLAVLDFHGYFQIGNTTLLRLLDVEAHTLNDISFFDLFLPAEYEQLRQVFDVLKHGHPVIEQVSHLHFPQKILAVRWSAYPSLADGKIYFSGDFQHLTPGSSEQLRTALDIAPVGMLVVRASDARIQMINSILSDIFGYSEEELLSQKLDILLPEDVRERHRAHFRAYFEQPTLRPMGTNRMFYGRRKNGEIFPLDIGLNPLTPENGDVLVVCSLVDASSRDDLLRDMNQKVQALRDEIASLEKLAATDDLTGVFNRRTLLKQLELHLYQAYENRQPLSVAMLDMDHFKRINDQHGHQVGDRVLQTFVRLIRSQIRTSDILGRYGGDEFTILMPRTPADQALAVLERIRANIAAHDWSVPDVSVSIGFSTWTPEGQELPSALLADEILLEADIALYHAKQSGRNTVRQFSPGALRPAS